MSDSEKLDVIVVGAGLAGFACAYEVARSGFQVAVLERGDISGSKNLSGGRLYLEPVKELCGELLENITFERPVVSESIVLTDEKSSVSFRLDNGEKQTTPNSATVLMSRFLKQMAVKVSEKGAMILPQQKVNELVWKDGNVAGVKIGTEELMARVVVAADGALSFIADETGLRSGRKPGLYGLGFKEIIQLESSVIENRFNLSPGHGASRMFIGKISRGLPGGGFIYTNSDSLSIGIVVNMHALQQWKSENDVWELLEFFKTRPDVEPLIDGGTTVEYGAHLIPEGGFKHITKPGLPGLLLTGDAAGFVLNTGNTLRGMDLALASGCLAGRCIVESRNENLNPEAVLKNYIRALDRSFVIKQMKAFKNTPELLNLKHMYERYPSRMVQLSKELFEVNKEGKSLSFWRGIKRFLFKVIGLRGIRDILRFIRTG